MERNIQELGRMDSQMDRESKFCQMELNTQEIGLMGKQMD
jgi:hypothetical protein